MEAKCSFGLSLKQDCHKLSYTRKTGLKKMADMPNDICKLLLWDGRVAELLGLNT